MALQVVKELELEHLTNQTSFKVVAQSLAHPYVEGKINKDVVEGIKLILGEGEQYTQFAVKIPSRMTLPFTAEQIRNGVFVELFGATARPYVRNGFLDFAISAENYKQIDSKSAK